MSKKLNLAESRRTDMHQYNTKNKQQLVTERTKRIKCQRYKLYNKISINLENIKLNIEKTKLKKYIIVKAKIIKFFIYL